DDETGIYAMGPNASPDFPYFGANFWQDWERPIHLELFIPDSQRVYSADAGVKIFGAWSRGYPQKSLALFARDEYGVNSFDYPLFPDLPFHSYEAFLLRNSGNDWESSMFRDGMMTSLVKDTGLDVQAYRPVVVYLNGEYWGIHNMREKQNEHFIAAHHPVDPDELDYLENNADIIQGDAFHYNNLINFIQSEDLTDPDNYQYISTQMEMDNYITYQVSEIYFDNQDWPGNNVKFWRPKVANGRWRWILYDTDFGFGIWNPNAYQFNTLAFALEPNGPVWPNPPWSTYLFRSLMENSEFKSQFINRFCDLLNTIFEPEYILSYVDSIKSIIEPEMPDHLERWYGSVADWNARVSVMEFFGSHRADYVRNHLQNEFNLANTGLILLGIANPNSGKIQINTVTPDTYPWHGYYFQDVDIQLTAHPAPGYYFSGWSGMYGIDPTITISPANVLSVTAYFEPLTVGEGHVVINEINYRSPDDADTQDWIELHNNGLETVNISFWQFRDSDDGHQFILPENTFLDPGDYVILCQSLESFSEIFPEVTNVVGDFGFGLSRYGESLRLFNSNGGIVDSLTYTNTFPWPTEPDGNGPTLELIHPDLDNSLPESWSVSVDYGTPGWENSAFLPCMVNGDANLDGEVTVSDIVLIIGFILLNDPLDDLGQCNADVFTDGQVDVLDIVAIVSIILDE
ncbi:MAG: CotH kinase family protein, partial [Fidelibacterota bacterium]